MADKFFDWVTALSTLTNATGTPVALNGCNQLGYAVTWPDNSTAGVVTIEQSPDAGYSGVWEEIDVVTWGAELTKIGGTWPGPLGFVRARLASIAGTHTDPVLVRFQGTVGT